MRTLSGPANPAYLEACETLAGALEYPGRSYPDLIASLRDLIDRTLPGDHPDLQGIQQGLRALEAKAPDREDRAGLQMAYTDTFDLQPVCTLGCGYHVFGESYKRGRLLAGLQETADRYGIEASPRRLPDELPVLLRLLPRLLEGDEEEREEAFDLLSVCLLPALEKMEKAFGEDGHPFAVLITAAGALLRHHHPDALEAVPESTLEVLRS